MVEKPPGSYMFTVFKHAYGKPLAVVLVILSKGYNRG